MTGRFLIAGLVLLALTPLRAQADSACWLPSELRAYDITMLTLAMAHEAAACDGMNQAEGTPLRAQVATFLGQHEQQLDLDRDSLAGYYRRAYGEDWQTPLNKSMEREDARVGAQVKSSLSAPFCANAASAVQTLAAMSWDQFVAQAEGQQWHAKAGFPECP